ncbi:aldo-keto reductase family 1 member C2-like [Pseudophryne corroboree]|uniref:aldo-keto reductase family 1 member C2-like n=1 Tax=Pseudophryne corroboree TaxID=495146 RepID=UPI003081EFD0
MALAPDSRVLLNDGNRIPAVGLGTFAPETPKELVEEAVKVGLEVGYRHIDSALMYGIEAEVGRALKAKIADGTVKREDVFYTTKLWNNYHAPDKVRVGLEESLKIVELDYVDLFLIHTPVEFKPGDDLFPTDENGKPIYHNTDIRDTWKAMEDCKDAGLTKSIGVSNFNHKQLERILTMPGLRCKPACNQVECHLYLNQHKLLAFCKSHDITLMAYSVLGSTRVENWYDQNSPVLLEDPVLNTIAKKHGRPPAQVAMRHMLQRGILILAKSFKPERIKQNFQVFEFELSEDEIKALDGRNQNLRYLTMDVWKDHPNFPFNEEY